MLAQVVLAGVGCGAMTLPVEEANSLVYVRIFLRSLLFKDLTPGVPDTIRKQARARLKHFPSSFVLRDMVAKVHGEDVAAQMVDEDLYWNNLVSR